MINDSFYDEPEKISKKKDIRGRGFSATLGAINPLGAALGAQKGHRLDSAIGSLFGALIGATPGIAMMRRGSGNFNTANRIAQLGSMAVGAAGAYLAHGKNKDSKK